MPKKQYRILQVIPAFETGGVEQGTLDVAHALAKEGHSAFVVSEGGSMVTGLPQSNAFHIQINLNTKNPAKIFKNSLRLKKLIREERIDLVHARSRAPAWSAYLACKQTKTPFVTTFHSTYGHKNPLEIWYNSVMVRGTRIIAISNFIRQHIIHYYQPYTKNSECQIDIIHRGVDLERFNVHNIKEERCQHLRDKWNIPKDHSIIIVPGRVVRRKGHKLLLEILKNLSHDKWICLFVGKVDPNSQYTREINQKIKSLNLQSQVKVVGNCTDMPAVNLLATIVLVNSTVPEAFGRTMAEAGAVGTPVIASALGAAPEIIEHGKTGWLIPPDNPNVLTEHLNKALSMTSQQREAFSERAQKRIRGLFTKETMCEKTLKLYEEVIAKHRAV